jgi:hypothetical protein
LTFLRGSNFELLISLFRRDSIQSNSAQTKIGDEHGNHNDFCRAKH